MIRPDLFSLPDVFKNYVDLVSDLDLFEALQFSNDRLLYTISTIDEARGEFRYEAGKWSIKETLVHIADVERIFAYRALRFSRNDKTPLPSFEDNDYVRESNAHARTLAELSAQSKTLRQTTTDLFRSFSGEMLNRKGPAGDAKISVVNLGFAMAGHELHHTRILTERYLKNS